MRTIVDLPVEQVEALARICEKEDRSRASVIREAVGAYLAQRHASGSAFGLWKDRTEDGLAYQDRVRSEWGDRGSVDPKGGA